MVPKTDKKPKSKKPALKKVKFHKAGENADEKEHKNGKIETTKPKIKNVSENNETNNKGKKRKFEETVDDASKNEENVEKKRQRKKLEKEKLKKATLDKKERSLFVKNFPNEFTEDDLKKLSSDIVSVKIEDNLKKSKSAAAAAGSTEEAKTKKKKPIKKTAFLEFKSKDLVEKNLKILSGKTFPDGQKLFADFVGAKSSYVKEGFKKKAKGKRDLKRLHVKGFDKTVKEKDLKKLFPKCIDFFMQKKRDSDLNLGFAFVQFKTEEEAKKIRDDTNGKDFKGKQLLVDYAILRSNSSDNKNFYKTNNKNETNESAK